MGRLRAAFDRREPSVVAVVGPRGVGKSALMERVAGDYRHLFYRCPPLAEPAQLAALWSRLTAQDPTRASEPQPTSWHGVLGTVLDRAEPGGPPFVLVLDDAFRLAQGRSRLAPALQEVLAKARAEGRALHIGLVSHGAPHEAATEHVAVGPLPLRAAIPLLPGKTPRDFIRAYAVFGGVPRVLCALDTSVTLSTNIRGTLLERDGTLAESGFAWLERDIQNPTRYVALLTTLAQGEADWATLHRGVPDLTASGQVAPYLRRLEELGLVASRRSLDAGPRSRSRRYDTADPFFSFWFRFVLPRAYDRRGDPTQYLNEVIRPHSDAYTSAAFQGACRRFMLDDAVVALGSNAREGGSLWGPGYDISVAGTLASGPAYYGSCHWSEETASAQPLEALDTQIRDTRYGFGREWRMRVLFTARPLPRAVERDVARRADAWIVGADAVTGIDDD